MDQCSVLLRTPSSITPGKSIIYWNLHCDVPLRWVAYFPSLGVVKLLSLHWDLVALLQTRPVETHYTWNERSLKEGTKVVVLLSPVNMYGMQTGQIPKAAATSTSKDQTTSIILIEGEDFLIQVPSKYLSFLTLDSCCPCGIWLWDRHLMALPFYSGSTGMPGKGISPTSGCVGSCLSLECQDCHNGSYHSREGLGRP